ncbi:hypothetical protein J0S82_003278, partial [Galemys pyrenaicus]
AGCICPSSEELVPQRDAEITEEELEKEEEVEELAETVGLTEVFLEKSSLHLVQKLYSSVDWENSLHDRCSPITLRLLKLPMEHQQQLQQLWILPGPNSALSGGMSGALPSLPGKI